MPKRKTVGKWNPQTQELDWPPTKAQTRLLRDLCVQTKVHMLDVWPHSRREAGERIEGLINPVQHRSANGNELA
jgi:hypothetical protein